MRGFTLIEIIMGIFIISLITFILIFFIINISNFNIYFIFNLGKYQEINNTINIMSRELKSMMQSSIGNYPIEKIKNNEIIFYANIDNDNLIEKIRYFVDGSNFKKGVTKPQNNPLFYDLNQEKIILMISDLRNSNIFQYFNKNNELTSDINQVKLIKVNLIIEDITNKKIINRSFIVAPRNLRYK
ncbi:MAG: hypothetical protein KatS3mg094_509 [Candidatus Parcubacteria bacterium]|nr:MAG: hypothetical protein KatS3mg094_509 [Candidatus Parcubacteria bacterium]